MDELLGSMTTEELREWRVFDSFEPIGQARDDYHAAYLAYMIAATTPRAKGRTAPKMKDFVIDWWRRRRSGQEANPQAMATFAAQLTRGLGGQVTQEAQAVLAQPESWPQVVPDGDEPGPDDGGSGP